MCVFFSWPPRSIYVFCYCLSFRILVDVITNITKQQHNNNKNDFLEYLSRIGFSIEFIQNCGRLLYGILVITIVLLLIKNLQMGFELDDLQAVLS